jgi:16S rRNA (guanine527-N7)-methyltransferase
VSTYREFVELELHNFQIELPQAQRFALAAYCDEVDRWNRRINLTGLTGADLVRRLVAEPVWIASQLPLAGSLTDIGSGNGSPAIPIQIVHPFETCRLIEARVKRAAFLRHLTARLNLCNVEVHRDRFEDIAPALGKTDWITLQAVALSDKLIDSIRLIAGPTTTVVWITSPGTHGSLNPRRTLTVPITGTEVSLYRLDLS